MAGFGRLSRPATRGSLCNEVDLHRFDRRSSAPGRRPRRSSRPPLRCKHLTIGVRIDHGPQEPAGEALAPGSTRTRRPRPPTRSRSALRSCAGDRGPTRVPLVKPLNPKPRQNRGERRGAADRGRATELQNAPIRDRARSDTATLLEEPTLEASAGLDRQTLARRRWARVRMSTAQGPRNFFGDVGDQPCGLAPATGGPPGCRW